MDRRYCEKCGAQLQPGDRFCENCGQAVDEPLSTGDRPLPPPVHMVINDDGIFGRRRSGCASGCAGCGTTLLVLVVLILAAGFAWWRFHPGLPFGHGVIKRPTSAGAVPIGPQPSRKPADFAGIWVMTNQAGKTPPVALQDLNGTLRSFNSGGAVVFEFTDFIGGKLSGTLHVAGQTVPATADLTDDRNELIIMTEDPPGHYTVYTFWRQGTYPAVRAVARQPRLGPNADAPDVFSPDEAISIVQGLPEVMDWRMRVGAASERFDVTANTRDHYTVRAEEPGGKLFGVYSIDKKTGKVYSPIP